MSQNSTAMAMNIHTGINPSPIALKPSVGKLMGLPCVYHSATPRAVTIMPSVAIKGGILT